MSPLFIYFAGFLGLAIGAAFGYFYFHYKNSQKKVVPFEEFEELRKERENLLLERSRLDEKSTMILEEKVELERRLAMDNEEIKKLTSEVSAKNSEISALNEKLVQQKAELENMREKLKVEFENVANKIFEDKSRTFNQQSKMNLELLLNPLKEKISEFQTRVDRVHSEDIKGQARLLEKIKQLQELNNKVTEETENLTKALKGDSKFRGNWGEMVLEKMLQAMGLEKDVHYFWQKKFKGEDDRKDKQPDIVINLPDDRHIIVDSKVSLKDYAEYHNSEDEGMKKTFLKRHLESVESHIRDLSEKDYHDIHAISTPDFVIMFMPIEGALNAALEEARERGKDLFREAFEKKIILASTATLFPIFRTVSYIWQQEKQSRNALEIAKRGGELYDKFVGFLGDMQNMGKSIESAKTSYEAAFSKLYSGRGNLIRQVEMIRKLGAKAKKEIPPSLVKDVLEE